MKTNGAFLANVSKVSKQIISNFADVPNSLSIEKSQKDRFSITNYRDDFRRLYLYSDS